MDQQKKDAFDKKVQAQIAMNPLTEALHIKEIYGVSPRDWFKEELIKRNIFDKSVVQYLYKRISENKPGLNTSLLHLHDILKEADLDEDRKERTKQFFIERYMEDLRSDIDRYLNDYMELQITE